MAHVIWHNAQGAEKDIADKLSTYGALSVKTPNGKAEYAGPHTLKIERNLDDHFAIHITPQGRADTIIIPIDSSKLASADLKYAGKLCANQKTGPDYKSDNGPNIANVRELFCQKVGEIIQEAFADTKRIADKGSTAYFLASQILNMEISAQSRIGGQSTGIAQGR